MKTSTKEPIINISKILKHPSLISLRFGGKIGKTCLT